MLAALHEAYIAPDIEVTESETDAFKQVIGSYSRHIDESRELDGKSTTTIDDCLYASAHWLSLLNSLKSTHYFLAEAMEDRDDASDLVIHSSEIQQACKSVLSQMFLIACNIYRLGEDLEANPELLDHIVSIMNTKLEAAGLVEDAIQLELFA